MIATSAKEIPIGYTSLSNSSSGSIEVDAASNLGESGSVREEGNHSCMPRAPYVHQGTSTSSMSAAS